MTNKELHEFIVLVGESLATFTEEHGSCASKTQLFFLGAATIVSAGITKTLAEIALRLPEPKEAGE